jgi:hypothetical protein
VALRWILPRLLRAQEAHFTDELLRGVAACREAPARGAELAVFRAVERALDVWLLVELAERDPDEERALDFAKLGSASSAEMMSSAMYFI